VHLERMTAEKLPRSSRACNLRVTDSPFCNEPMPGRASTDLHGINHVRALRQPEHPPSRVYIDMKRIDNISQAVGTDRGLVWTMRVVGLMVIAASVFFLTKNVSLNPIYDYFFATTGIIGFLTFAASWTGTAHERWNGESNQPQMELVRADQDRRR
jgi:hypothetical protein